MIKKTAITKYTCVASRELNTLQTTSKNNLNVINLCFVYREKNNSRMCEKNLSRSCY